MSARILVALSSGLEAGFVTTVGAARGAEVARRCPDVPDLLAAASAGLGTCAAVSPDLPHLDRDVLDQLRRLGLALLGVVADGDEAGERRLRQLGVETVVTSEATPADIEEALAQAGTGSGAHRIPAAEPDRADLDRRFEQALAGDLGALERPDGADGEGEARQGEVIAVWGPTGAPGRTTIAITLAAEYAAAGVPTLLVDADTYGASVAQSLGLLDDTPGLAAVARAAEQGTLDVAGLVRRAPEVSPGLRVLTGLPRADRWPEVRDAAMAHILELARAAAEVVVVDCGFNLEADEELAYDTAAPRRNAATLTTLEHADHLVAVGAGDPVGLQRLVRGLSELGHVPSPDPHVVVTRVRASAAGPHPGAAIRDVLARFSGVEVATIVPDDREACDAAMLAGRTLVEHAPTSRARTAVADLARRLLPDAVPEPVPRSGRRGRRRAGRRSLRTAPAH